MPVTVLSRDVHGPATDSGGRRMDAEPVELEVRPPKQQRSREAWNRVLDAGVAILEDGGYDAFTIAAVCERAAVAPTAIYARTDQQGRAVPGRLRARHRAAAGRAGRSSPTPQRWTGLARPSWSAARWPRWSASPPHTSGSCGRSCSCPATHSGGAAPRGPLRRRNSATGSPVWCSPRGTRSPTPTPRPRCAPASASSSPTSIIRVAYGPAIRDAVPGRRRHVRRRPGRDLAVRYLLATPPA